MPEDPEAALWRFYDLIRQRHLSPAEVERVEEWIRRTNRTIVLHSRDLKKIRFEAYSRRHPESERPLHSQPAGAARKGQLKPQLSKRSRLIAKPPGVHLRAFADAVFSLKTRQLVLEPTLRDLYDEHCEALKEGRLWKARWVLVRGYGAFWSAVIAQLPVSMLKKLLELWKAAS